MTEIKNQLIRPACEPDLDAVCRIEEEAFSVPWKRHDYEALLEERMAVFLVLAEENGDIAAYGCIRRAADEGDLLSIAVRRDRRGCGCGARLLRALLREAEEKGTLRVFLEVRESNEAAIRMYQAAGFEKVGIRKNYYTKPDEDAWLMRRRAGVPAGGERRA